MLQTNSSINGVPAVASKMITCRHM